jgi:hypothetical protein
MGSQSSDQVSGYKAGGSQRAFSNRISSASCDIFLGILIEMGLMPA